MAVEITPLGFKKPDGNELVRGGDNVIADNAETAQVLLSDTRNRLGAVEAGAAPDPSLVEDPDNPGTFFLSPESGIIPDPDNPGFYILDGVGGGVNRLVSVGEDSVLPESVVVGGSNLPSWVKGVNVKDYGAVGDNTADDTAAINAALVAAQGRKLTFPIGQYKVSGNLVNFWGSFPVGEGSIVRGAEEYFITPTNSSTLIQTSTLWANYTTGVDTNDGLFSVSPVKTMGKIYYQMLRRLTPEQANGGYWKVRMSGTFTGGQKYAALPEFAFGLTFEGDALVGGDPVTIVDYNAGDPGNFIGMWFEPGVRQVTVKNIKFTDFTVGFNGYGILMKDGGTLTVQDCWANNCDIGIAAVGNVSFSINDSKATACGNGFSATYSSSGTFDHCTADANTTMGFSISRNAVAHIDYCLISNNPLGVVIDMAARVNITEGDFQKNAVGVKTEGAGEWIDASCIWNVGTANANTITFKSYGVGRENRQYSQGTHNEFMISSAMEVDATYATPQTVTGTVANTIVYLGSGLGELPAGWFTHTGKAIRCRVYAKATTTTGTGKIRLYVTEADGSSITLLSEVTIPSGASSTPLEVEFKVWAKTATTQLARANLGGGVAGAATSTTPAIDMATKKLFRLYCLPGATGDSFTFDNMEIFCSG